ncbi:unnamed protein product [Closterium sp. Naga37s-1]|nr:unnamed protein product [Closterium sp. Naga37s-1]
MAGSLRAASSFLGVGISHPKLAVKVPSNLRRSTASGRKINTDRDGNSRKSRGVQVRARADGEISLLLDFSKVFSSTPAPGEPVVSVDNESSENYTIITVSAQNRPGLLQLLTLTFRDLGLDVGKAVVDLDDDGNVADAFYVTAVDGKKITQKRDLQNIRKCVVRALVLDAKGDSPKDAPVRPARLIRPVTTLDPSASPEMKRRTELLHNLMDTYIKNDVLSIQRSIVDHVEYTMARSRYKFDDFEAYQATAYSVRDRLIESWNDTQQYFKDQDSKRVYYLSMEFLMGRSLLNSIFNLGMKDQYVEALGQLGYKLEVLAEQERDAALGNGGLGRLAACVLDSMATLNYPGWGYGIRYQYGMFRQTLQDGFQHEQPDYWLTFGNPWEIERVFVTYPVRFYGTVESYTEAGHPRKRWVEGETVEAVAYDNPIPGYHTNNTINLRLWGAKPSGEFDLQSFNTGDYVNAILSKQKAEAISSVLYPDDRTYQGKELRLKQQHFFVSATMQDVVRRYKEEHSTFDEFKDKVALQLNDTHPVLALVELMRLLVDEEGLEWGYAWNITTHTFSYTNHTVLPEALEKWPVEILETLLPRHLELIYDINHNFIVDLKKRIGNDYDRLSRMSIIEEGAHKSIRMATLAVVTCHTINGVSQIHTDLIENTLFKDFYDIWPHKFQNKTNGVTQRRWLAFCNPGLAAILTQWLGTESWITNLDLVAGLKEHVDDPLLQTQWMQVRRQNKARLAAYIEGISGIKVSIDAMFDVQVKRIHEYKRQLLNVMGIIHRYDCIKKMSPEERKRVVPRVCLLGGKAAPGYDLAKKIVKLISAVSEVINKDEDVGDLLKLVFIPDYNVSLAELIIPASDLSQHISTAGNEASGTSNMNTAGNEASGTSNMKFAMNGCLILGTLDGATREIREEIGPENMFVFGAETKDVPQLREERRTFTPCRNFTRVVGMIRSGYFGWTEFFAPLMDSIDGPGNDYYLLANDFSTYLEAQVRPSSPTWRPRCARPHLPGGPGAPVLTYLEAQVRPSSPTWRPRCALPHLPGSPGAPFPTYLEAQVRPSPPTWRPRCALPHLPGGPGAPVLTYLEAQVRPSSPTWRPRCALPHLPGGPGAPFPTYLEAQVPLPHLPGGPGAPFPTYLEAQAAIDATNVDVPKQTHMSISSTAGAWFGYPPLPPPFTFPFLPPFSLSPGGHRCNAAIDATYVDVPKWTRMSISSTAGCGRFTSDRTIKEYAEEIWDVQPITRPY